MCVYIYADINVCIHMYSYTTKRLSYLQFALNSQATYTLFKIYSVIIMLLSFVQSVNLLLTLLEIQTFYYSIRLLCYFKY